MRSVGLGASLFLALLASGAAHAVNGASTPAASEASIRFVQYGGIRNWKADRDHGLWIQDSRRRWYYAKFMGRCFGLNFATSLGFDARPMGTFDRFSSIVVPRGGRCTVRSVVASDGPPRRQKKSATEPAAENRG